MAENKDNALAPAGHDGQAHADQRTADPPSLHFRFHTHGPEPHSGRLSIYENTEELDMRHQFMVTVRDE